MLHDISKRKTIRSNFDRKRFDDMNLRMILKIPKNNYDGCTTTYGVQLVKRINADNERAKRLQMMYSVMKEVIMSLTSPDFRTELPVLERIIREFRESGDVFAAHRDITGIWKILESLRDQRKFFVNVKDTIKANKVSHDWYMLISESLDGFEKRMLRLEEEQMNLMCENSPAYIYRRWLAQNGEDVIEDLGRYVCMPMDTLVYGKFLEEPGFLRYLEHVYEVIDGAAADGDVHTITENSLRSVNGYRLREEAKRRDREEKASIRMARLRKDAEEIVFQGARLCKRVLIAEKATALRRFDGADAYFSVVCKIPKTGDRMTSMYVHVRKDGHVRLSTSAKMATLFHSEEECAEAVALLRKERPEFEYVDHSSFVNTAAVKIDKYYNISAG